MKTEKQWDWTVEFAGMTIQGNGPKPSLEELDKEAAEISKGIIDALNKALEPRRLAIMNAKASPSAS